MKRAVTFTADAWSQYTGWKDAAMIRRINRLIADIQRDPDGGPGIGKPELLKGPLSGYASRRIDGEHRLVYRVTKTAVEIVACRGHY